jgi:hypothetical protein
MNWTRSETLALAQQSCVLCYGLGLRELHLGAPTPCACVFRAVFRACFNRFREYVGSERRISQVSLEAIPGKKHRAVYSRKDEEYVADFVLVSRRMLNGADYQLFKFHFLLGADWKLCTRRLGVDRGSFYHQVYRIQERLGRVFAELEPYALFPVDEYFSGNKRRGENREEFGFETTPERAAKGKKLRFPVKRAA